MTKYRVMKAKVEHIDGRRSYATCPRHGQFEVDYHKIYGETILDGQRCFYTLCPTVVALDVECREKLSVKTIKIARMKKESQNCDGRCLNGMYSCNCSCMGKCHGQGFCSCDGRKIRKVATKGI